MKTTTFIITLIISINGFCKNSFEQLYQADLPRKAMDISYYDSGKIKELIISTWNDRIKTETGQTYYKYEQGYSYEKKQGFLKVYDLDGKLIEEKWDKAIDGGISQEEALVAIDLFKKNDAVKRQFSTTEKELVIYTGFNFLDKTECSQGNRCVHVFASSPDVSVLAHSIVRLTDLSVPYPEYSMETTYKNQKIALSKANKQINK